MRYDIRWLSLIVLHERGALNINILEHRVEIFPSHNPGCCVLWLGLFQGNQNWLGRSVVYVTCCANHVNHIQLKKDFSDCSNPPNFFLHPHCMVNMCFYPLLTHGLWGMFFDVLILGVVGITINI